MNRAILSLVLFATLLLGACSLLFPFDQEGQPCDSVHECAQGLGCKTSGSADNEFGVCSRDIVPNSFECGGCPRGTRCDPSVGCIADTCAGSSGRKCEAGQRCVEGSSSDAGTSCQAVPAGKLGAPCRSDGECSAIPNGYCYVSTVQDANSGGFRSGICVEACSADGALCSDGTTTCRELALPLNAGRARLCLPAAQLPLCRTNVDCAADGLVCALFDHLSIGPALLCASPLTPNAARIGEACTIIKQPNNTPPLCNNGLCIARADGVKDRKCGQPCDLGTCPGNQTCALVDFPSLNGIVRHVPLCVDAVSYCGTCPTGTSGQVSTLCGPDAPFCEALTTPDDRRCVSTCLPDAGTSGTPSCPGNQTCTQRPNGTFRCLPAGGACN